MLPSKCYSSVLFLLAAHQYAPSVNAAHVAPFSDDFEKSSSVTQMPLPDDHLTKNGVDVDNNAPEPQVPYPVFQNSYNYAAEYVYKHIADSMDDRRIRGCSKFNFKISSNSHSLYEVFQFLF